MISLWFSEATVLDWLIRSTLLIWLAWITASIARRLGAPAALRHLLWLMGIFCAAALPLAAALAPFDIAVLPSLVAAPAPLAAGAATTPATPTLASTIALVYVLAATTLLLRIVFGQWRLAALWRRALSVDSINSEATDLATTLGLGRGAAVRLADCPSAPMTWGALRPKILLPAAAVGWPAAQRRLVLMHELAHVARADSLTQLFASIVLSLFWFQPALWFAAARLRTEQEHACDDRVITAGATPFAYARTLLNVAAGRHGDPDLAPAAAHMAARSQLEGRLNAIVAERRRRVLGVASRILAIGAGVAVLIAAATAAPAPAAATPAESAAPATTFPIDHTDLADAEDVRNLEDTENVRNVQHAPTPRSRRAPRSHLSAPPVIAPLPALPAAPAPPAVAAAPASPASPASPVAPVSRAAPVARAVHPAPVAPAARISPPAPVSPVAPVSRAAPVVARAAHPAPVAPAARISPPAPVAPVTPVSRAAPVARAAHPAPVAPPARISPPAPVAPVAPASPVAPAMPAAPATTVPVLPAVAPTPAAPAIAPTPAPSPQRVRTPAAHPSD